MQTKIQKNTTFSTSSWRKLLRNIVYFGVPVLVAISSAVFPIRPFLRQAMTGFILVWFVVGGWLFAAPK
jgi:hypothetical protein